MTSSFITLDASKLDPSQIGDISTDLGIENVHAPETLEVVRIVFLAGEVAADGTLTKMIRSKKDKGTGLYNPGSGKWLEAKANDPNVKHYVPSKLKIFNYRMDENGTIYYKESKESDDWLMVPIYTDVPALVEEDPDLVELLQKHKTCKEIVTLLRKNGYYVPSVSAFNLMRSDYELDENEDSKWSLVLSRVLSLVSPLLSSLVLSRLLYLASDPHTLSYLVVNHLRSCLGWSCYRGVYHGDSCW